MATTRINPHEGSDFANFLKEEGILEEVEAVAIKRVIAFQIAKIMDEQKLSKSAMAQKMETSRSQLDRLLDPENDAVTLHTLWKAAKALGKRLDLSFA